MQVFQRTSRCLHTWPNIRPVTSTFELANSTLLSGAVPPTATELSRLLERKANHVFGGLYTHMQLYRRAVFYTPAPHTHAEELKDHVINRQAVFTNSELSLKYVDMYGFDFDYTLVHYKQSALNLIYGLARNRLVEQLNVSD